MTVSLKSSVAPAVAIIIVNWNGKADTLECLESLSHDAYSNKRIIVIDNGSADDSASILRSAYPKVTVLETGVNLGFTGGNNVGIRYALSSGADYLFLLNNDTTVEPDAIGALIDAATDHDTYGVLLPVIHYHSSPEDVWFAGSRINLSLGIAVHNNSNPPDRSTPPFEIPWGTGCAMLIPSVVMHSLAGFDDRFYLNWEDVDLSLRAQALGFKVVLVPASRIYHKISRSFSRLSGLGLYYSVRNNLLCLKIHAGASAIPAIVRVCIRTVWGGCRDTLSSKFSDTRPLKFTLFAIYDFLCGRYGPFGKRKFQDK